MIMFWTVRRLPICPTGHGEHRPGLCTIQIFDHTGESPVDLAYMLINRPASMHIGRPVHHTHCHLIYKNSSPTPDHINSTVGVITMSQINAFWVICCLLPFALGSLDPSAFQRGRKHASLHLSLIPGQFVDRKQWCIQKAYFLSLMPTRPSVWAPALFQFCFRLKSGLIVSQDGF